ncbi:unnamed protein product, partial [Rotaria sordida]
RRRYSNEDIASSTLSSLPPVCSTTSSSTTVSLSTSLTSTSSFLSQSISSPTEPITPSIFQLQTTISVFSPSKDSELSIVDEHNCTPTVFQSLSSNKVTATLKAHEQTQYHQYSTNQANEFITRHINPNLDVDFLLNVTDQHQQNEYKKILFNIVKCILFLAGQNLALRGHSDDGLPWIDKQSAIIIFRQLFGSILIVLEYLSIHGDSETSALSGAYHKSISSDIEFITSLIIVSRVFALTKPYTENLQSPTCDLVQCYDKIEELALYLTELLNDDNIDKLYDDLIQFSTQHDISFVLSRRKKITPRAFFESIYQAFISSTIDELGPRFSTHQKLAVKI